MKSIRFGLIAIVICGLIVLALGIRVAVWTKEADAISAHQQTIADQLAASGKSGPVVEQLRDLGSALFADQQQKFRSIYLLLAVVVVGVDALVILAVLSLGSSVQRLREEQREQVYEAMHDALTSLPNRRYLGETLMRAVAAARRAGRPLALLYIDLDGFKEINDRFGHEAGDRVLQVIAARLRRVLRAGDFVARLGGDEFVAVLADPPVGSGLALLIARLQEAIEPAPIPEVENGAVRASIGVAWFPADGESAEALLAAADRAMYEVKEQHHTRLSLVADAADEAAPERRTV